MSDVAMIGRPSNPPRREILVSEVPASDEPIYVVVRAPVDPLQLDRLVHGVLVFIVGYFWMTMNQKVDVFATGVSWSYMASLATQRTWMKIFAALFILSIVAWAAPVMWMRTTGSTILALVHMGIALMFYVGNPNGTAFGPYFGYAILAAAVTYKAAHDQARTRGYLEASHPP